MEESFKTSKYRVDTLVQLAKARSWGAASRFFGMLSFKFIQHHSPTPQALNLQTLSYLTNVLRGPRFPCVRLRYAQLFLRLLCA